MSAASNLWPGVPERGGDEVLAVCQSVGFRSFSNALRIIRSLDFHELEAAGFRGNWPVFRKDPVRYFMRSSFADAAAIWTAIERRHPDFWRFYSDPEWDA